MRAVTVVVASVSGTSAILECLEALATQPSAGEIVLVDRCHGPTRAEVERRFPAVRVIPVEPTTSLPAMRARGLAAATGETIAVLAEHLRPTAGWVKALATQADLGRAVVGGPVEAGRLRGAAEWAFFLLEYVRFAPPLPDGPVAALAGTNCAYDRRLLDRLGVLEGQQEVFDADLHDGARALAVTLHNDSALLVRCEKRLTSRGFLAQRYHCSRVFAARRAQPWPRWRRLGFAAASLLLPPLLFARLLSTLLAKRRHGWDLLRVLPLVLAGLVSGAGGEAVGVLKGAGRSSERAE